MHQRPRLEHRVLHSASPYLCICLCLCFYLSLSLFFSFPCSCDKIDPLQARATLLWPPFTLPSPVQLPPHTLPFHLTHVARQNSSPSSGCLSFRFDPLVMSALIDISTSWILLSYRQLFMTSSPETTPVLLSTHGRLILVVNRTVGGTLG